MHFEKRNPFFVVIVVIACSLLGGERATVAQRTPPGQDDFKPFVDRALVSVGGTSQVAVNPVLRRHEKAAVAVPLGIGVGPKEPSLMSSSGPRFNSAGYAVEGGDPATVAPPDPAAMAAQCPAVPQGTISAAGGSWSGDTTGLSNDFEDDYPAGTGCYGSGGADEIHTFQVDTSGVWQFDTSMACWDTSLGLRVDTAGCPGDAVEFDGDSQNDCYYESLLSVFLVTGTDYYMVVDGWTQGQEGPYNVNYRRATGKCCYNTRIDPQCIDSVTEFECNEELAPRFFTMGATCSGAADECAFGQACQDCGGSGLDHWVDTCPAGDDFLSSGAEIGLDITLDGVLDTTLIAFGPVLVRRDAGAPDQMAMLLT